MWKLVKKDRWLGISRKLQEIEIYVKPKEEVIFVNKKLGFTNKEELN